MGMQAFPIKLVGMNDVFNPFTKEYVPFLIEGAKFKIPSQVNIQGQEWVAVNIGYVQLQSTLPTEYQLEILDTNGVSVLQSLTLQEQIVGNDITIARNQCVWFNENGLRGNYYIHRDWLGKILHIKRGLYVGTAVSSTRLGAASIPPYYIQFANSSGTFDANEAPNNWYKKVYGIDTTWELMFNTESVYFRTEGSLASSGRSSGKQGDAGRNATGGFAYTDNLGGVSNFNDISGIYYGAGSLQTSVRGGITPAGSSSFLKIFTDISRAYTTANEFRTLNRLIRVYHLLSVNGVNVNDILRG